MPKPIRHPIPSEHPQSKEILDQVQDDDRKTNRHSALRNGTHRNIQESRTHIHLHPSHLHLNLQHPSYHLIPQPATARHAELVSASLHQHVLLSRHAELVSASVNTPATTRHAELVSASQPPTAMTNPFQHLILNKSTHPQPRVMPNSFQHPSTVSAKPNQIRHPIPTVSRNRKRSWIKSRMTTRKQTGTPHSETAHTGISKKAEPTSIHTTTSNTHHTTSSHNPQPRVMPNLFQHLCAVSAMPNPIRHPIRTPATKRDPGSSPG